PSRGLEHRANQLALLAGLHHAHAASPQIGELLAEVEASDVVKDADSPESANIREMRWDYDRLTRQPRPLIEEMTRTTSIAHGAWAAAWERADFALFEPWLARIVAQKRLQADALGYSDSPYDALIQEHEPGACTHELADLFRALRDDLVPLANTF